MDEQEKNENRPVNPRRRKRSQFEIFKEAYLPVIIAGVALLMIFIFIIGSIVRGVQRKNYNARQAKASSIAAQQEQERLDGIATSLLSNAQALASQFDYEAAIKELEKYPGDMSEQAALSEKHQQYTAAMSNMVLWDDPSQVLNLSYQLLIADTDRAFTNERYGNSFKNNFITTAEFSKILQQLYENGYILVSLDDITDGNGPRQLYLPKGKKPVILTQTNVCYNTYLVDSDGDKLPDAGGGGFASKLMLDEDGGFTCQMVDKDGNPVTGDYDLIPILESFIEAHPDFSYRGARAIIALTGYDGVLGYRTSSTATEYFGKAFHDQQVAEATKIAAAVKDAGYDFACYSYSNESYGTLSAQQIETEMQKWADEVVPIIGETDIFVFCQNTDLAENGSLYSGTKFQALHNAGFRKYLGFCKDAERYFEAGSDYIRMGRLMVTGNNLRSNQSWFEGIIDPSTVLDKARG